MVRAKVVSSLDKVFLRDDWDQLTEVRQLVCARGERVSFQVVMQNCYTRGDVWGSTVEVSFRSKLRKYIRAFRVGHVPSEYPVDPIRVYGDYITVEPGLFPDVLEPLEKGKVEFVNAHCLDTFWFTAELPEDLEPGVYPVYVTLKGDNNSFCVKASVKLKVMSAVIPENDLKYTQWFHCDCIADYFGVKMMSEKHFKLIDRFMATAAHTGITMILTPLFTPPLDTAVGTERPTMQLVKVRKEGDRYFFDFKLLERWVAMAKKHGFKYYELSHLFSQWGVCACPKIMVEENGKVTNLFGWDVASDSEFYRNFLDQFLPALLAKLEELGIRENCYFHISDEPHIAPGRPDLENYTKASKLLRKYIGHNKIMDAMTQPEFYEAGLTDCPIPNTDRILPFLELDIPERWCYYCGAGDEPIADRLFAMPSYRNRVSGLQMYMHDMQGFLQWGFNFYYSWGSKKKLNPYQETSAGYRFVSGDAFSVYPYKDGAIESLRAVVFFQGLQDRMLLKALEAKLGKDGVKAWVRQVAGKEITFYENLDKDTLLAIHDQAIEMLSE